MALDKKVQELFEETRSQLGADTRKVELTDESLCKILRLAVKDYASRTQMFIIKNNWATLYGKTLTNEEIAHAFSVRTLDITKDYSYYFSKEVGLQQRGPWELKKDFFQIECGKQCYTIPAGREINKVMWLTPPTIDAAKFASYGGYGVSFGGGVYGQMGLGAAGLFGGFGAGAYGMGAGLWALPAADIAYMASDLAYKNSMIRSDLIYKVTAGPDGTHIIHLMSTPGSKLVFGNAGLGQYSLSNCYVWYTYYDTSGSGDADECRKANPDVILSPDQIPLEDMDYVMLNSPAQAIVTQLFIGRAAEQLAFVRGKFSGVIMMPNNTLTMDYNMLISYGQREREAGIKMLNDYLEEMSPYTVMQKQAELVDNLKKAKSGVPLGMYSIH